MLRLEAEAVPACLDDVHRLLGELWAATDVPGGARARFATAVAELVANVVEHGRTAGGAVPRLVLCLDASADRLRAELRDDGTPVPVDPGADLPDELAEHGRGLPMVQLAADELGYAHDGAGNRWSVVVLRG